MFPMFWGISLKSTNEIFGLIHLGLLVRKCPPIFYKLLIKVNHRLEKYAEHCKCHICATVRMPVSLACRGGKLKRVYMLLEIAFPIKSSPA